MSQRLLITAIALGLVLLAVGGWLVEAARWAPRALSSAR
jgi:hypothetical protein